jgi:hypothetical protein
MSEDKRQGSEPQLDPKMVAEFRAYGGFWKFLAASLRVREQGGNALTTLRMPNGELMGSCSIDYHKRVSEFLGAVGRMGALEANATLRELGVL